MGFGGGRKDKTAVDLEALSTLTADDILNLSGGVVVNEAGQDRDFRVESQSSTHALFVDASTSTVGIGTSGPGDYNDSADNLVVYRDGNGGITIANGVNDYGTIYFADATSGDGSHAGAVQYHHGTNKLFFGTAGTDNRVTIDSSGNLGIGTTSPATLLDVRGPLTVNSNGGDVADGAAVPLTSHASLFVTGGSETSTLAAGSAGQIKVLAMKTDGGDMITTVTPAGWKGSGPGTVTFDTIGDCCVLQYIDSKWFCIANNGAAFA